MRTLPSGSKAAVATNPGLGYAYGPVSENVPVSGSLEFCIGADPCEQHLAGAKPSGRMHRLACCWTYVDDSVESPTEGIVKLGAGSRRVSDSDESTGDQDRAVRKQ